MNKSWVETKSVIAAWQVLENKDILVVEPRLKVSVQRIRLPNGKIIDDYYQICLPEAVVVVARTTGHKVVTSKQYLHGLSRVSVVLPSGTMKKGESPLKVAQRELLEETGYTSSEWQSFGSYVLHNNYGCGRVHFFFADNTKLITKPNSGDLEEMEIILMDKHEITNAIKKGEIIAIGSIMGLSLVNVFLDGKLF